MDKKTEALKLALECIEKLWNIIDDIDTYSDMAKADEKLYRLLVERRQRTRFEETGISADGYTLNGGAITAIREALAEQPAQRTWVGLTDEEMNAALDYWSEDERSAYGGAHAADEEYVSMIDTWRYIEAKLKEKNNG